MEFREGENIELKSIVVDDIKKDLVAFANSGGGRLYIGVWDDGTVIGVDDPDGVALQVSNIARDSIKPDLTMFLGYRTLGIEEKHIVEIDVQRGAARPYYISRKGLRPEGVYVRQGHSSVPATDAAIRQMIKDTDGDRFEDMRSLIQNLTFTATEKEFVRRDVSFGPTQMKTLGILNAEDIFTNLGLILSDQFLHTTKAAVFEGTHRNVFKDRKEFAGPLFRQMGAAYEFIDFRNQTRSTFDGLYRTDTRDYPEVAVREALLNSFVHREYALSAATLINIYEDRIELTSLGGLVGGVTLEDVLMGISVCRNPKLANVLYRLELIEAYGTGLRKIMDAYEGCIVKPTIQVSDNVFQITLPNRNYRQDTQEYTAVNGGYITVEEEVISLARQYGAIKRIDVQEQLGMAQTTSGRLLKQMLDNGQLLRRGKGKNTHYVLPNSNRP